MHDGQDMNHGGLGDIPQCNLQGTVFGPGNGINPGPPVAGVKVNVLPATGDKTTAVTGRDGTYNLLVNKPGEEQSNPYEVMPAVPTQPQFLGVLVTANTGEISDLDFTETA